MRRFGKKLYLRKLRAETGASELRQELLAFLKALGGDPVKARLASIWREWQDILGEELGELAKPLGADKKQLLIGVEDALVMQEIQYRKQEILDKVNLRLGEEYFEKVRASIMLGREARDTTARPRLAPNMIVAAREEACEARGTYLAGMDPNSAVAKAYAIFARKNKN